MQVVSTQQSEIQMALEGLFAITNAIDHEDLDVRALLESAGFPRATRASAASLNRLESRLAAIAGFVQSLPTLDVVEASALVNEQLTELTIAPAVVEHDGVGPHLHWTPATATFDDQVIADVLMAVASEICDNGTIRFGQCGADGCTDLFYDGTRNRSRRFCDNPRCASRTHTADHRARRRQTTD